MAYTVVVLVMVVGITADRHRVVVIPAVVEAAVGQHLADVALEVQVVLEK